MLTPRTDGIAAAGATALTFPDDVERLVQPCRNAKDEAAVAAEWLVARRAAGTPWRDMVVAAPGKRNWRDPIAAAFDRHAIPCRMLLGYPDRAIDRDGDHVHVVTLHAVATQVFDDVAVLGVGDLPWKSQTLDEVTGLLQTAMSRATQALLVLYSKPSTLVERLRSA